MEIKRKNNETWITLEDTLDIGNVADLINSIKIAVKRKPPIVIDAGNVSRIHAAAMQVLLAFVYALNEKETSYRWQQPSEVLQSAAAILGLEQELNLDNGQG